MKNIPLTEWKAKYGRIYRIWLENEWIYFRLLNAEEINFYRKDPKQLGYNLDSIILNNKSLSSTGAKYKLSDFVIKQSFPNSEDELKERILHHRFKIKDDFLFNLIARLCSVYVSYTPDQLRVKSFEQLLELTAIAELMTGKQLLGDNKKHGKKNFRMPNERNDGKFKEPNTDELMDEASSSLQEEMLKFGKDIPKFKKESPISNSSSMQQQMEELNKVI